MGQGKAARGPHRPARFLPLNFSHGTLAQSGRCAHAGRVTGAIVSDDPKVEGTAYSRTLQRAADRLGGVAELAEKLGVGAPDLERWIAGASRPPQDVFLAALDIVAGFEQQARRTQQFAHASQRAADRAQAAANRAQARADRIQAHADRLRRLAGPQGQDEQLRTMSGNERRQPSNQAADKVKKKGDSR